jgi:hypothetical protein
MLGTYKVIFEGGGSVIMHFMIANNVSMEMGGKAYKVHAICPKGMSDCPLKTRPKTLKVGSTVYYVDKKDVLTVGPVINFFKKVKLDKHYKKKLFMLKRKPTGTMLSSDVIEEVWEEAA